MKIWTCKIGTRDDIALPHGADQSMRQAVEAAYAALVCEEPEFTFSGWGAELTEGEMAVVEDRMPASLNAPENDADLFGCADARVWADRFVYRVHQQPELATSSGALLAWFAGAIEAGRDAGRRA